MILYRFVFGELPCFQEKKMLFVESRDNNEVWEKYVNAVNRTEKGAILCAVAGGKLSEGAFFLFKL